MVPLDKKLQWVNVKQKHPDRYRHIQTLWSISRNYSGIFQTLSNPGIIRAVVYPNPDISKTRNIFRTLLSSKTRYIQNSGIIKTQCLFRHLRRQASTMKHFVKIVENTFAIKAWVWVYVWVNWFFEPVTLLKVIVIVNTLCTVFLRYSRIMLTVRLIIKIFQFPNHVFL